MQGQGYVTQYLARGCNDSDSELAEFMVDEVVGDAGGQVPRKKRQEEQGHHSIGDAVVRLYPHKGVSVMAGRSLSRG